MNTYFIIALLLGICGSADAAITQTLPYQGFLSDRTSGQPVSKAKDMLFRLCDSVAGDCSSPLFSETRCAADGKAVFVMNGRYDVEIGSHTSGGIPAAIMQSRSGLWLEILSDTNDDCAGFEALSPRVRLQSSPYAFKALHASTASAASATFRLSNVDALASTQNGGITVSTHLFVSPGRLGVGTLTPRAAVASKQAPASEALLMSNAGYSALNIVSNHTSGAYLPGAAWATTGDNPDKPKVGIWVKDGASGSSLNFGAAHDFSVGIASYSMTIDAFGQVGIGTSAPSAPLHVNGVMTATPVQASYYTSSYQDTGSTTPVTLAYSNIWYDSSQGYFSNAAGVITFSKPGWYLVHYQALSQMLVAYPYYCKARLLINGVTALASSESGVSKAAAPYPSSNGTVTATILRYFNAGDTVRVQGNTTVASRNCRFYGTTSWGEFWVVRLR
ncbi:MAG: hypothetical protein WC986_11585 [Elusimicrobiota bacterium]|jgi:hypothetical protein